MKENLYPLGIIDDLYIRGLVDEDRAELIRKKPRCEMVNSTLRNIVRRVDGPDMLSKLISVLKETNILLTDEQQNIAARNRFARQKGYGEKNICLL